MQQKEIFLSHASKDKALADKLADLLTSGCDVSPNKILCTTLEGKGIPAGTSSFIEYLRQQIQKPRLVILLLSENFFASHFCLCELGAVWGMDLPSFPIVVPPLDKGKLKATLAVTQAGDVTSASYLDELRDKVQSTLGASVPTPTWNVKRDSFLNGLADVLSSLEGPSSVPAESLKAVEEKYQAAMTEVGNKEKEARTLRNQIDDLEKCKDSDQVRLVDRKYSSSQEQFEKLVALLKTAFGKVRRATISAIFCERRDEFCHWADRDEREDVREAEQRQEVIVYNDHYTPNPEHIRVAKARDALRELDQFLRDKSQTDLIAKLEGDYEFPINLKNKEFWHRVLEVYPY